MMEARAKNKEKKSLILFTALCVQLTKDLYPIKCIPTQIYTLFVALFLSVVGRCIKSYIRAHKINWAEWIGVDNMRYVDKITDLIIASLAANGVYHMVQRFIA